jgi:pseudouridine kinase
VVVRPAARERIVCAGNAALDRTFALAGPARMATSNPAQVRAGFGGVARNVADNLARLGVATALVTQVGDDAGGRALRDDCAARGIDVRHVTLTAHHPTSEYVAIIDPQRELVIGASASAAIDAMSPAGLVAACGDDDAAWTFADCNLPASALAALIEVSRTGGRRLAVDAVSIAKAARLPRDLHGVELLFVNGDEARALLGEGDADADGDIAQGLRARGAAAVVLTRGARGALVATAAGIADVPAPPAAPVDVTGAGDALIAGTLFGLLRGETLAEAVRTGTFVALLTIESRSTVAPALSAAAVAALRLRFAVRA